MTCNNSEDPIRLLRHRGYIDLLAIANGKSKVKYSSFQIKFLDPLPAVIYAHGGSYQTVNPPKVTHAPVHKFSSVGLPQTPYFADVNFFPSLLGLGPHYLKREDQGRIMGTMTRMRRSQMNAH